MSFIEILDYALRVTWRLLGLFAGGYLIYVFLYVGVKGKKKRHSIHCNNVKNINIVKDDEEFEWPTN